MLVHSNNFSHIFGQCHESHSIAAHDLGKQAGPTLTTFTDDCTNFLFDYLLLHGHTLCNIIKQGKVVVSWCVCPCVFSFFLLSWAWFLKKKKNCG